MAFIDEHYTPGHVLARNRALFDWQYEHADGTYNLAVARDESSSNVLGILGFIDSARYDASLSHDNCLWLALWQVRPDAGSPTLGPALLAFVRRHIEHTVLAVAGVRAPVLRLYQAMGFVITGYRHYYIPNPDVSDHRIAIIPRHRNAPVLPDGGIRLDTLAIDDAETLRLPPIDRVPARSTRYFVNRYLRHPFYRYDVHVIQRGTLPVGLIATRTATWDGRSALRIVDMLAAATDLPAVGRPLLQLLRRSGCEYADLLVHGAADACLRNAGFTEVDARGGEVIPNHFEPFVRENRPVTLCYRRRDGVRDVRFQAFKADGDQDRPNQL